MAMNCKTYRMEIEEAVSAATMTGAMRAHLEVCAPCFEFYDEQASLVRLVGELEKIPAPPDFEFRLRARIAASESAGRKKTFTIGFAPGLASVALAAAFGLTVAGSLYFRQSPAPARVAETNDAVIASQSSSAETRNNDEMLIDPDTGTVVAEVSAPGHPNEKMAEKPRRRANPARLLNVVGRSQAREASADFSSRAAEALNLNSQLAGVSSPSSQQVVAIPLRTSSEPLKVVLRDERGTPRVVSMKSVSFGSQELMGRSRETTGAVSPKDGEGVW